MFLLYLRNEAGITLPFALILTFIFSALVSVGYLFVSVNLNQMQSNLHNIQAIAVAEGINERIKARLNTKTKPTVSPEQEEALALHKDEFEDEFEDEEGFFEEEDFDEETESFDEYYADEVLKISRYITFREPPAPEEDAVMEEGLEPTQDTSQVPEANVEMIGSISVPRGTVFQKGLMLVVYKEERLNLKLEDISPESTISFKNKIPVPLIKELSPNYCEANSRCSFAVIGENLDYDKKARFTSNNITIEDIKSGPFVEFLISMDAAPGETRFYWENAYSDFYIIPKYDGSYNPIIDEVKTTYNNEQLLKVNAGQRGVTIVIYGQDLFLQKSQPVVIPNASGIVPTVNSSSPNGKEITVSLNVDKKVSPGVYSLIVATEGGLSNAWLFNVLPAKDTQDLISTNTATYTSSLTLLDVMVVDNLLPLVDEGETLEPNLTQKRPEDTKQKDKTPDKENNGEDEEDEDVFGDEVPEKEKLSPFANTDLETVWLLETSSMVGRATKTISEIIHRQIPDISGAITTNGEIDFSGGSFNIVGTTTAMTVLVEPTYLSSTTLIVPGPTDEESNIRPDEMAQPVQTPGELGFIPEAFVAVYKNAEDIYDLDYGKVKSIGINTIELFPPGLMNFHYENEEVYQFNPPIISKEKIEGSEAIKHIVPRGLSLTSPSSAIFKNLFNVNLDQFAELADLYTNEPTIPVDDLGIPLGYMGLSYVEGTPVYDNKNALVGKGVLVIDTRADNSGEPSGVVEINGDSKSPADFTGVVYVRGNLKIEGNANINGALIVDNGAGGMIEIGSSALGKITYSDKAVRQSILYIPFATKPGTITISNKPINLEGSVIAGEESIALGASPNIPQSPAFTESPTGVTKQETELVQPETTATEEPSQGGRKTPEQELIDLF